MPSYDGSVRRLKMVRPRHWYVVREVMEMWSWAATGTRPTRGRSEKELAKFAKLEYGTSEIGWLLDPYRRRRGGRFWARIRSRIVRYLAGGIRDRREMRKGSAAESETSEPQPSISPTIHVNTSDSVTTGDGPGVGFCTHPALEYLGSGGNVTYQRCPTCGAVLISQGGREVMMPTTDGSVSALDEIE